MRYYYFVLSFLLLFVAGCSPAPTPAITFTPEPIMPPEPVVRIHYLGHASFLLQFDNGVSVLTDYGQSNAYDLNSPIYDWTRPEPDVVTFSHTHPDHNRPGVKFEHAKVLTDTESLNLEGLEIIPIRTSENSIATADNSGYLFTYKGMKILHLGDAQAYIKVIKQDAVKQKVKELYPDTYDLLLMTIEGVDQLIPQAEEFMDLLQPVRVIPMHYWSPEYKSDFLAHLREQNGRLYTVVEPDGAEYELYADEEVKPVQIISLDPAPLP